MTAKITVRAELASLLAKSQETTDANRQAQLRKEADLKADRQRLQAKEAREAAARKNPLEDPVGRNIFTAAMGQQGYPVAYGFDAGDRIWSGNGAASLNRIFLTFPAPSRVFEPLLITDVTAFRLSDRFMLPLNGTSLVYCYRGIVCQGTSSFVSIGLGFDGQTTTPENTTYGDDGGSVTEEIFCALVSRSSVKEIPLPSALLPYMQAANPNPPWVPGGVVTADGGQTYGLVYGQFGPSNPSPIGSQPDRRIRFDLNEDASSSPSIYGLLGANTPVPPSFALAACQLTETCELDKYGYDLTKNPDDSVPIYRRNKAADLIIPEGRITGQLFSAWDWGRPGYCREQLLALGFTPADLTP